MMHVEVLPDPAAVAHAASALVAREARAAVALRQQFTLAVSGGHTPLPMLRAFAGEDVPWSAIQIFQVDERVAPEGDDDRNLTQLHAALLAHAPIAASQIHAMPVASSDLESAAASYAAILRAVAGSPAVLDMALLGLGADGHTASLLPGDPVLDITDRDVALAGPYEGRRRMTLTYPVLNRARHVLWMVTGQDKADALLRLFSGDARIPGGRVEQRNAQVFADRAAARRLKRASAN
ncbi:MAG: 6-phosphogluconolactonase [Casimicrobiaceae bacterium]